MWWFGGNCIEADGGQVHSLRIVDANSCFKRSAMPLLIFLLNIGELPKWMLKNQWNILAFTQHVSISHVFKWHSSDLLRAWTEDWECVFLDR